MTLPREDEYALRRHHQNCKPDSACESCMLLAHAMDEAQEHAETEAKRKKWKSAYKYHWREREGLHDTGRSFMGHVNRRSERWRDMYAVAAKLSEVTRERDEARADLGGPLCEDSGFVAVCGECPVHNGDACLKMGSLIVARKQVAEAEVARLREALAWPALCIRRPNCQRRPHPDSEPCSNYGRPRGQGE